MTTELRTSLRVLRATLRNAGVPKNCAPMRAWDAAALWLLARVGDVAPANEASPPTLATPLGSYEAARELTLAVSLRVTRSTAGRPQRERDEVFERCHAFEDMTRELLYGTTRRRGAAPATTTATSASPPLAARGSR
jgi:hypothetical protein